MMDGGAVKKDTGKVQVELLSPMWLMGVGQVLTFGASKYHAHNWRYGLKRSRLLGACLRHVFAYLGGEDKDPETGLLHLYHASCCLMFASELHFTRPDLDDRFRYEARDTFPSKPGDSIFEDLEMHGVLHSPAASHCGHTGHASELQREVCRIRAEVERGDTEPPPEVES